MYLYLFRLFDRYGQQESLLEKMFPDDLGALEWARALAQDYAVEIWDRGYRVAYVKSGDPPPTVIDR